MPPTALLFNHLLVSSPNPRRAARRRSTTMLPVALALAAVVGVSATASAQSTREERQAAERAEKAMHLRPYEPTGLERRIQKLDGVLSSNRPIYLSMGSSFDGAGLAIGPGYRLRFGDTGALDARATVSIRNYKTAEAALKLPRVAGDRVMFDVHGSWIDAPRVAFFGVGADTARDGRAEFEYSAKTAGVGGTFEPAARVRFGASLDVMATSGTAMPGVSTALDPTYRRTALNAQFDSRPSPDYARRGSLARVEWADYHQTSAGTGSFRRLDAEVQQLVPLMHENWVLAFRALASTTDVEEGQEVPYFLLPALGGSRHLRGYSAWRFRDRNRLLFSGEYRWTAGPLVDMAIFVDAGKVAARRADLNLTGLKVSQGVGIRFHTPSATVTRFEVARSQEGTSVILSFSPSF